MLIRNIADSKEFIAGDNTNLKELLTSKDGIGFSLAHARVKPGETTYRHSLNATEVYIILEGHGNMTIDSDIKEVKKDDMILIPSGSVQSITNTGQEDLLFLCIVSPPWTPVLEKVY